MKRALEVSLDGSTWTRKSVPPALNASVGTRKVDIRIALLFTALCTRPPLYRGFDLSDFWAWLRYLPAIAATPDLRLLGAWSDIDPHQKNVLSDQLGIGFTTQFLAETYSCGEFVDTIYVANILDPKHFKLGKQTKTGPRKSPDYVAKLPSGDYIVVECKGTQTSRKALMAAFVNGRKQKKNLTARSPKRISDALIAGLFIPQWKSKESALIHLEDPTWAALDDLLADRSEDLVRNSIERIALAKNLALCGIPEAASWLVSGLEIDRSAAQLAVKSAQGGLTSNLKVLYETLLPMSRERSDPTRQRVAFSAQAPEPLVELIGYNQLSPSALAAKYRSHVTHTDWLASSTETHAELVTPLGFKYRLTIEQIA